MSVVSVDPPSRVYRGFSRERVFEYGIWISVDDYPCVEVFGRTEEEANARAEIIADLLGQTESR